MLYWYQVSKRFQPHTVEFKFLFLFERLLFETAKWLTTLHRQGKTSKEYLEIKKMAFLEPKLLHAMLKSLADSIGDYANYQVRHFLFFVVSRYTFYVLESQL